MKVLFVTTTYLRFKDGVIKPWFAKIEKIIDERSNWDRIVYNLIALYKNKE